MSSQSSLNVRIEYSCKAIFGLKLLCSFSCVIDEGEAGASTATKHCAEAKHNYCVCCYFVQLGQFGRDVLLRDISEAGMDDLNDHLLSLE
jgi:hypothetical protein